MVEHAIEDNAHPARVYTVYQPPQVVLCTEGRVDQSTVSYLWFDGARKIGVRYRHVAPSDWI